MGATIQKPPSIIPTLTSCRGLLITITTLDISGIRLLLKVTDLIPTVTSIPIITGVEVTDRVTTAAGSTLPEVVKTAEATAVAADTFLRDLPEAVTAAEPTLPAVEVAVDTYLPIPLAVVAAAADMADLPAVADMAETMAMADIRLPNLPAVEAADLTSLPSL